MISTLDIKKQQFSVFRVGNQESGEVIMIIGSCRSVPYLNYLDHYNKLNGNKYLIYFIDPFNYNWDKDENRVDSESVITELETDRNLLNIFASTKIFIHEYYANFGMFNTFKEKEKNIYKFGMNPEIDITIPNFHDVFIMFNDIAKFDNEIRAMAQKDIDTSGELSDNTLKKLFHISQNNLNKFYDTCSKSNFPEMVEYFKGNFLITRLYWTYNHVSKYFTLKIFEWMNNKYLKLPLTDSYWNYISKEDIFANNYTSPTKYDKQFYDYQWNEPLGEFKL